MNRAIVSPRFWSALVSVPARPAADVQMKLDQMLLYLITFTFLLVLPLAFAITGVVVWWRRRKAL